MATILGRMLAPLDGRLSIKLHDLLRSHGKLKPFYLHYHSTVPMATTLGRMVTYLEVLLTIKLNNALIT